LPTALLKERLAAMDANPFNIEYNTGLENIIKSFLKSKKSFERLGTSEYYFPIFEEALAKQNVPLEIKYLAIVESALNPKAVSKMGNRIVAIYVSNRKQYGLKSILILMNEATHCERVKQQRST
jgi:membrane-bound lytic murein transglycosylase D